MKNSKQFAVKIPEEAKKFSGDEFELMTSITISQALRSANIITQEVYEGIIQGLLKDYGLSDIPKEMNHLSNNKGIRKKK